LQHLECEATTLNALTKWQMQHTEREHARQVLKNKIFNFNRLSGTDTPGRQEFSELFN